MPKDPYNIDLEERAVPVLLQIFERQGMPQCQLSNFHCQIRYDFLMFILTFIPKSQIISSFRIPCNINPLVFVVYMVLIFGVYYVLHVVGRSSQTYLGWKYRNPRGLLLQEE